MSLPSPLTHSWPLFEQQRRFDLGTCWDAPVADAGTDTDDGMPATQGIGRWECDLADDRLTWSAGVFDLFGLPRDAIVTRAESIGLYAEPSRTAMERLRAYAIRHRRGFTLDAEIVPAQGPRRWMRLIAAPVCIGARVVRLGGLKQDVSALYR